MAGQQLKCPKCGARLGTMPRGGRGNAMKARALENHYIKKPTCRPN